MSRPPDQPGFPVALDGAFLASGSAPTLVDLDGNGNLEVVIAGRSLVDGVPGASGMVYAYRHDGTLLWQTEVRAPVNSAPTAADLTGDGHPDLVVAMGGYVEPQSWNGGVTALDGTDGQELWTFDTADWLNHSPDGWLDGVYSTPAVGDVNGDGHPEVAFGAWDQCAYLLDRFGLPLWGNLPGLIPGVYCGGHGYYNEDVFWSSPALADLTGDGLPELIIGGSISPGNFWGDPAGGYLYVFSASGQALAREWMDQVVDSSPALADLDNDGTMEIAVATGMHWAGTGYYVSTYDYSPGPSSPTDRLVLRWRRATSGRTIASPSVADLDHDGWLDIVNTAPIGEWGSDGSFVFAWRGADGTPLFQRRTCDFMGHSGQTISSPVVGDVDADGWDEILFAHLWEVAILNHDGTYYSDYTNPKCTWCGPIPACARDHTPTTELTYWAEWSLYSTPALGDLDGDGDLEIVIGGHNADNPDQGMLFAWTGHHATRPAPWPTWRHDVRHTGCVTSSTPQTPFRTYIPRLDN